MTIFAVLVLVAASAGAAAPSVEPPEPDMQRARPWVEDQIRAQLSDPESARIEWPYEMVWSPKAKTHWTCGRYNSRNRMGGYAGADWFTVAFRDYRMVSLQFTEESPWIGRQCADAARNGELKPRM